MKEHLTGLSVSFPAKLEGSLYSCGAHYHVENAVVLALHSLPGLQVGSTGPPARPTTAPCACCHEASCPASFLPSQTVLQLSYAATAAPASRCVQDLSLYDLPAELPLASVSAAFPARLTCLMLEFTFNRWDEAGEHKLQDLSSLTALQRLSVSGILSGEQEVPSSLKALTYLSVQDNYPDWADVDLSLSFGGALPLLELETGGSHLLDWPGQLEAQSCLTELDLYGSWIRGEPSGVWLPPSLLSLSAGMGRVVGMLEDLELPALSHLTALQYLRIEHCEVQALVAALTALAQLTTLDVSYCSMEAQPVLSFSHMHRLAYLRIRGCNITEVPQLQGCARLLRLALSHNEGLVIGHLLRSLPHLERVLLSRCSLCALPDGVTELASLSVLHLRGNSITLSGPERRWLKDKFGLPHTFLLPSSDPNQNFRLAADDGSHKEAQQTALGATS